MFRAYVILLYKLGALIDFKSVLIKTIYLFDLHGKQTAKVRYLLYMQVNTIEKEID
jgi:hypothetical protein